MFYRFQNAIICRNSHDGILYRIITCDDVFHERILLDFMWKSHDFQSRPPVPAFGEWTPNGTFKSTLDYLEYRQEIMINAKNEQEFLNPMHRVVSPSTVEDICASVRSLPMEQVFLVYNKDLFSIIS